MCPLLHKILLALAPTREEREEMEMAITVEKEEAVRDFACCMTPCTPVYILCCNEFGHSYFSITLIILWDRGLCTVCAWFWLVCENVSSTP